MNHLKEESTLEIFKEYTNGVFYFNVSFFLIYGVICGVLWYGYLNFSSTDIFYYFMFAIGMSVSIVFFLASLIIYFVARIQIKSERVKSVRFSRKEIHVIRKRCKTLNALGFFAPILTGLGFLIYIFILLDLHGINSRI